MLRSDKESQDTQEKEFRPLHGPVRSAEGWCVFVTGLHEEAGEDDIADAFSEYGKVNLVKLNLERKTGRPFSALVEFEKQSEAQDAINKLHGTEFLGKTINVHWAFVKPAGSRHEGRQQT